MSEGTQSSISPLSIVHEARGSSLLLSFSFFFSFLFFSFLFFSFFRACMKIPCLLEKGIATPGPEGS